MGKQWKQAGKLDKDSKKGALFTRLAREIQVASRLGGSDTASNPRLKLAVHTARTHSLPKNTIDKAIAKGAGTKPEDQIEEVIYEGFGPYGLAFMVHCLTDNRVRTVSEIRFLFKKCKGNMGANGSVAWMFNKSFIQGKPVWKAKNPILLEQDKKMEVQTLLALFEENPDCQAVYTNLAE